jgi:transcriptional pleiotropic regulator of transition state genes
MKSTGVVRRIDDLGRVVLPKELRRTLNINEGDPLEVFVDGEYIMLKKYSPGCIVCGDLRDIKKLKNGAYICGKCLSEAK